MQEYYLPIITASLQLKRNDPHGAIDTLTPTISYELGGDIVGNLYPAYVRGQAYFQAGQPEDAAREFQKLIDNRGVSLNWVLGSLAYLQRGRAEAAAGDDAAAEKSYAIFLEIWKGADPDIPILIDAKKETQHLRRPGALSSRPIFFANLRQMRQAAGPANDPTHRSAAGGPPCQLIDRNKLAREGGPSRLLLAGGDFGFVLSARSTSIRSGVFFSARSPSSVVEAFS